MCRTATSRRVSIALQELELASAAELRRAYDGHRRSPRRASTGALSCVRRADRTPQARAHRRARQQSPTAIRRGSHHHLAGISSSDSSPIRVKLQAAPAFAVTIGRWKLKRQPPPLRPTIRHESPRRRAGRGLDGRRPRRERFPAAGRRLPAETDAHRPAGRIEERSRAADHPHRGRGQFLSSLQCRLAATGRRHRPFRSASRARAGSMDARLSISMSSARRRAAAAGSIPRAISLAVCRSRRAASLRTEDGAGPFRARNC